MVLTNISALGVPPDKNGQGLTAHYHRRILRYLWDNPGIVGQDPHDTSLQIKGRTDLKYDVTRGMCVVPRDASYAEGFTEAYVDATVTDAVPAGDANHPRIDVIWIRVNDLDFDDTPQGSSTPTNRIEIGVTVGTPAASPAEPAIPVRAWRLGAMRMPAGATSTQSATKYGAVDYAVPYGGGLGIMARVAENKDLQASSNPAYTQPILTHDLYLPTDRWIYVHCYLCVSTPSKGQSGGVAAVQIYVDGQKYTTRKVAYTDAWVTHEVTATIQLSAGRHTLGMAMYKETGPGYVTHYSHNDPDDAGNFYVGRVMVIKDEGVAR